MTSHQEIGTLSFRASSLAAYEQCARKFAADYIVAQDLQRFLGVELREKQTHIGAAVGSSVHKGNAYMMNELAVTGSFGDASRRAAAIGRSLEEFSEISRGGLGTDAITATTYQGEQAIQKMVDRLYRDNRPETEPEMVEHKLEATFTYGEHGETHRVLLTGTPDTFLVGQHLPDVKTGGRPQAYAQMGIYKILIEANKREVDTISLLYLKRVKLNSQQPAVEEIKVAPDVAVSHAKSVVKHANRDMRHLLKSGDPESLVANPGCFLCDPRFCPAFGTSFCRIGALVHPERMHNAA